MRINDLKDVLILPGSVLSLAEGADAKTLRVLLWLASDLTLASKHRQLAKLSGSTEREAREAIAFWQSAGILGEQTDAVAVSATVDARESEKTEKTEKTEKKEEKKTRTLVRRADELPNYTSTELAELLEKRQGMRELIDEAQQILGKMFNPSEVNILVGMVDYLAMDVDCILLLLAHCRTIGKSNLRAVEKLAYSLVDAGVTDAESLEERLRQMEAMQTFEGEVRALFGMKSRALTAKERRMLSAWCEYGFGIGAVKRAYEITIGAINTPSVAYADAILKRWSSEGLRTEEEIDAYLAREATEKEEATTLGNSFDADDFFEAALKRSFSGGENA